MQYKGINLKVVLFVFYNNDFGSYLCRLKREKTLFASLTLTGQRIPCSDMIFLRIDTLTVEKSDLS